VSELLAGALAATGDIICQKYVEKREKLNIKRTSIFAVTSMLLIVKFTTLIKIIDTYPFRLLFNLTGSVFWSEDFPLKTRKAPLDALKQQ
jgi:hypothetical protein